MSKVLIVNGNLSGHINPTLPVAAELVKRGEEVWYFCARQFERQVSAAEAHFIDSGEVLDRFLAEYKPAGNHPFFMLLEYIIRYDEAMIPILIEKTDNLQLDYMVCDSILGAGYFLKRIMKIPVISSISSFAMNRLPVPDRMMEPGFHPQLDEFYRILEKTCHRWNVEIPDGQAFFINKEDMNLVYTSRAFNPGGDDFNDSYVFVGPSINNRHDDPDFPFEKIEGDKVIYISLGTINNDYNDFYKMCMKALGCLNKKVVLSVGRKCSIPSLGEIPDNFIVCQYVPQLEVLQRSCLFISHAGFNSVSEALYYGVPIIAIPMANDQFMTANRLAELGAGITLRMNEINEAVMEKSVLEMIAGDRYYASCEYISESFHRSGGYGRAADQILEFVKG
ncbi:MAG: macrolide family glycosyltransferase [Saccharofermentanales bacterium]